MKDVDQALARMDAPDPLVTWCAEHGYTLKEAWTACDSPTWLLWLAGAAGFAVDTSVMHVGTWVGTQCAAIPELVPLAERTLDASREAMFGGATAACIAAAESAAGLAKAVPTTFRDVPPVGFEPLALALSWVARAAEGVATARVRAEAGRMERARRAASYLGAGVDTLLERESPIRLDTAMLPGDPFQTELLYVFAALAEALDYVMKAERTRRDTRAPIASASLACDQLRAAFVSD